MTVLPCRVGKQVGEFESSYLSDLDNGNLVGQDLSCGLEGKKEMQYRFSILCNYLLTFNWYIIFLMQESCG